MWTVAWRVRAWWWGWLRILVWGAGQGGRQGANAGDTGIVLGMDDKVCPAHACMTDVKASSLQTPGAQLIRGVQQALGARVTNTCHLQQGPSGTTLGIRSHQRTEEQGTLEAAPVIPAHVPWPAFTPGHPSWEPREGGHRAGITQPPPSHFRPLGSPDSPLPISDVSCLTCFTVRF